MKKATVMRGKIMPKAIDSKAPRSLRQPDAPTMASISWEEALARFLLMKKAQGLRERTVNDYRRVVALFFRRFPDAFKDEENLSNSVYQHMAQEIGPNTYNLRLIYLKVFFNWCIEENILQKNPLAGFKRKPPKARIVEVKPDDLRKLLGTFDCSTYTGLRDHALFLLQVNTGIRPGEALQLRPEHFRADAGAIVVPPEISKTKKERILPLEPPAVQKIEELLAIRPNDWGDDAPIFCGWNGEPMSEAAWYRRLSEYGMKVGLRVRPYDLRHFFAITFLRQGGNIYDLQEIMGHATLEMVKKYLHITSRDIRDAMRKASPLNVVLPQRTNMRKLKK